MTNQETLELALNALKCLFGLPDKFTGEGGDVAVWRFGGSYRAQEAIKALEEALAKQEQGEPVAWEVFALKFANGTRLQYGKPENLPKYLGCRPLYTTPQQRKPLTDEQFLEMILLTGTQELVGVTTFVGGSVQMHGKIGLLRSAKIIKEFVEAAHGIKE